MMLLSFAIPLILLLGLTPSGGDLQKLPPLECVDAKGKVVVPAAKIRTVGPGVSKPEKIHQVETVWPENERVWGSTIVEGVIDASGGVCAARVLKAPSKAIGEAVRVALLETRFKPARFKGQAVPVHYFLVSYPHLQ